MPEQTQTSTSDPEPGSSWEPGPDSAIALAASERLTFFSDAVVAIAITLLALQLPLPSGTTDSAILHAIGAQRDSYLAFLISFIVIGSHWAAHHRVFRYARALGGGLLPLNMLWLLTLVITPFATRVLTGEGGFFVRFTFYAAVQTLAGLLFVLMLRELSRHDLLLAESPPGMIRRGYWRAGITSASFAASIPVALLGQWAFALWIYPPLIAALSQRTRRHVNRRRDPAEQRSGLRGR